MHVNLHECEREEIVVGSGTFEVPKKIPEQQAHKLTHNDAADDDYYLHER